MIELRTQPQLRAVRDGLGFCCLCGESTPGFNDTKQHVPPQSVFAKEDRSPPLKLPAHRACNEALSALDEAFGQFVGISRGVHAAPGVQRFIVERHVDPAGRVVGGIAHGSFPMPTAIATVVRQFHAALYRAYIPTPGGYLWMPVPEGNVKDGKIVFDPPGEDRLMFVQVLKQQRKAGRVDRILICNDKCEYICTWLNMDNGREFCLFALRIYNWSASGPPIDSHQRGCMGWYFCPTPPEASRGTRLHVAASNFEKLDPFGP